MADVKDNSQLGQVVEELNLPVHSILAVSGDIETNPGPDRLDYSFFSLHLKTCCFQ